MVQVHKSPSSCTSAHSNRSGSRSMASSAVVICFVLLTTFTTVRSADPGDSGFCVNLTLPDVGGLGACLGDTLVTCKTSQTPIDVLQPLLECTLKVLRQAGSPAQVLKSVANIFYLLLNAVNQNVARFFQTAVNLLPGSVKLSGCNGTIVVSVPNTLAGECTTNLGNLCTTTVSNLVPGLVNALSCLVKNALNDSPASTVSKLLCDLTNLLDVGAGVPNTALDTIVDGIKKALSC
ncbi:uncharacterized protein LOC144105725 [Amblyomma americanum]